MKTKSMVDKRFLKITIIAIAGIMQGCSFMGIGKGDFDCPGGVDGVRCMSARQVYQATESSDYVKTKEEQKEADNKNNQTIEYRTIAYKRGCGAPYRTTDSYQDAGQGNEDMDGTLGR